MTRRFFHAATLDQLLGQLAVRIVATMPRVKGMDRKKEVEQQKLRRAVKRSSRKDVRRAWRKLSTRTEKKEFLEKWKRDPGFSWVTTHKTHCETKRNKARNRYRYLTETQLHIQEGAIKAASKDTAAKAQASAAEVMRMCVNMGGKWTNTCKQRKQKLYRVLTQESDSELEDEQKLSTTMERSAAVDDVKAAVAEGADADEKQSAPASSDSSSSDSDASSMGDDDDASDSQADTDNGWPLKPKEANPKPKRHPKQPKAKAKGKAKGKSVAAETLVGIKLF